MATFQERLNLALKLRDMTPAELSRTSGVNEGAISQYRTGAYKASQRSLDKLSKALNVSVAWLMGWEESAPAEPTCSIVPIRFLGEAAAGFDRIAYEEYEYLNVPEEWLHGHPASDYFAMRVTGSSMYPEYRDGDEILCLHCDDMGRSGRVGVFVHGEEATLKKIEYVHGEDWVDLVPINPEYETKRIEGAELEQCRVIGRAVRLIRTINQ